MGDLISRLQGDRVILWRPDVKKQHRTRAPLDQELVLRERRGRGVGQDAEGTAPAVGEIPAPRALQIRSSWPTERGLPGSGRVVVAVAGLPALLAAAGAGAGESRHFPYLPSSETFPVSVVIPHAAHGHRHAPAHFQACPTSRGSSRVDDICLQLASVL